MYAVVSNRPYVLAPGALLAPGGVMVRGPRVPFGQRSATVLSGVRLGASADQVAGTIYGAGAPVGAAAAGPAVASALGISAGLAVPLLGAAFFGIFEGIEAILHSGCGQTCVVTSQWANQAGDLLTQNATAYFALPVPRSPVAQTAYLANAKAIWNKLVQLCSQAGLGDAGKNCIADRQEGGCKWRVPATQAGPQFPGGPGPGDCFNWWNALIDPIANDPNVSVSNSGSADATGAHDSLLSSGLLPTAGGSSSSSLLWLGLGAAVLWAVFS